MLILQSNNDQTKVRLFDVYFYEALDNNKSTLKCTEKCESKNK